MVERNKHIKDLRSKIEEARKLILVANEEWQTHMNRRHGGYMATACHQCISYKTGIRSQWMHIGELQNEARE